MANSRSLSVATLLQKVDEAHGVDLRPPRFNTPIRFAGGTHIPWPIFAFLRQMWGFSECCNHGSAGARIKMRRVA